MIPRMSCFKRRKLDHHISIPGWRALIADRAASTHNESPAKVFNCWSNHVNVTRVCFRIIYCDLGYDVSKSQIFILTLVDLGFLCSPCLSSQITFSCSLLRNTFAIDLPQYVVGVFTIQDRNQRSITTSCELIHQPMRTRLLD